MQGVLKHVRVYGLTSAADIMHINRLDLSLDNNILYL